MVAVVAVAVVVVAAAAAVIAMPTAIAMLWCWQRSLHSPAKAPPATTTTTITTTTTTHHTHTRTRRYGVEEDQLSYRSHDPQYYLLLENMMIVEYNGFIWRGRWPTKWGLREALEVIGGTEGRAMSV